MRGKGTMPFPRAGLHFRCRRAAVAQLVEHVSRKDGVIGSNPIGGLSQASSPARRELRRKASARPTAFAMAAR